MKQSYTEIFMPDYLTVKIINKYKTKIEEKNLYEQEYNETLKASYSYLGKISCEKTKYINEIILLIDAGHKLTLNDEINLITAVGGRFCWETAEFFSKPCRVVLPNITEVFDSEKSYRAWFYKDFLRAIRLIIT